MDGETLNEKVRRLDRQLDLAPAEASGVNDELRAIQSPELDQIVRLAKAPGPEQLAAKHILVRKWDPFFKAIVSDIRHLRDDGAYSSTSSRRRLRAFARQFRGSDLLHHELDEEELKNQAIMTFLDLLKWHDPGKWKSFPGFIEHYLPLRMENWLQRELFRKDAGKLKLKRIEPMPDLEWVVGQPPDFAVRTALDRATELFESESVRRYLFAALRHEGFLHGHDKRLPTFRELHSIVSGQGFALEPVLVPRRSTLLTTAGEVHEPSRYYHAPRRRRFPLYIPRDDHLREFLCSPEISDVCKRAAQESARDKAWVVLAFLCSANRSSEADLARKLRVTQQRVSYLVQAGVRRLMRQYLAAYARVL